MKSASYRRLFCNYCSPLGEQRAAGEIQSLEGVKRIVGAMQRTNRGRQIRLDQSSCLGCSHVYQVVCLVHLLDLTWRLIGFSEKNNLRSVSEDSYLILERVYDKSGRDL